MCQCFSEEGIIKLLPQAISKCIEFCIIIPIIQKSILALVCRIYELEIGKDCISHLLPVEESAAVKDFGSTIAFILYILPSFQFP